MIELRFNYRLKCIVVICFAFLFYSQLDIVFIDNYDSHIYKLLLLSNVFFILPWTFNLVVDENGISIVHKLEIFKIRLFEIRTNHFDWDTIQFKFFKRKYLGNKHEFIGFTYMANEWLPFEKIFLKNVDVFFEYIYNNRIENIPLSTDRDFLRMRYESSKSDE